MWEAILMQSDTEYLQRYVRINSVIVDGKLRIQSEHTTVLWSFI